MPALALATTLWAAQFVFEAWVNSRRVDPGRQNESAFYRAYDPDRIISKYVLPDKPSTWGTSEQSSSDEHYVHHSAALDANLIIQNSREVELLDALKDDVTLTLKHVGARVTRATDIPGGGYEIGYENGNSEGTIMLPAPQNQNGVSLALGPEWSAITVKLTVKEKYNEWCLRCSAH